jgi:ubiquinone/menaquinone biosynthesis C-methylase UbiE
MSDPDYDPNAFRNFEFNTWEKIAPLYAANFTPFTGQPIDALLDAVRAEAPKRLLDVACGTGLVAARAAQRGCEVVGVDFSNSMLEQGRRLYPGLDLHFGDAERLDFADSTFDIVVSNFGVMHFSRPEQALQEMARVTISGGRIGLTIWNRLEHSVGLRLILDAVQKHAPTGSNIPKGISMFYYTDKDIFAGALRKAGYDAMTFQEIPLNWHLDHPDELVQIIMKSTVRIGAILQEQPQDTLEVIKTDVRDALKPYARPDGSVDVPHGALLASAARP